MDINKVLKQLDLLPEKEELETLKRKTKAIVEDIKAGLKKGRIKADVFVGGSFAKGTLIRGELYDIDIFVRFDKKYKNENMSDILEKVVRNLKMPKTERVHGSRDYFRIWLFNNLIFEIIPVLKIRKPSEAENVTDLSYFHVGYVKRKVNKKIAGEIAFAKQFCKAQKIYGAESYVNGFSGYGVECLIIYYKTFEKMLRALSKTEEKLVIDPEKKYKNRHEIMLGINESRLGSPIVLVDPTWKERNVLAALNASTFEKFQEATSKFLKNPGKEFFEIKEFDREEFKKKAKKEEEFVEVEISTDRQEGDIAGTKLKKFANFMERELEKYFGIKSKEFDYRGEKTARFYLIVKSKGEIIKNGPPKKDRKNADAFRKVNNKVYEKGGMLFSKVKIDFTAKKFIQDFSKKYDKTIKGMGISGLEIN